MSRIFCNILNFLNRNKIELSFLVRLKIKSSQKLSVMRKVLETLLFLALGIIEPKESF